MDSMKKGDKVVLETFNLMSKSNEGVEPSENYWLLLGKTGHVIQSPLESGIYASFSREKRLLIKFDVDLSAFHLSCHNEVENSLWILEADLRVI